MKICRLSSRAKLPHRATDGSAGYDLFAAERTVVPGAVACEGRVDIGRALVPTGVALSIPLDTGFQFRANGTRPLELVIATMPPWPGADEAVAIDGPWDAAAAQR